MESLLKAMNQPTHWQQLKQELPYVASMKEAAQLGIGLIWDKRNWPEAGQLYLIKDDVLIGQLTAHKDPQNCWEAYVVQGASAIPGKGLGEILYLAALWFFKPLAADRVSVSPQAYALWKKLISKGVEEKWFDDMLAPKTPPEIDDCELHQGRPELNAAYQLKQKPPGLEFLLLKPSEVDWTEIADDFFTYQYSNRKR